MIEALCDRYELPIEEALEQCDWPDDLHQCKDCANHQLVDIKGTCPECGEVTDGERSKDNLYTYWKCQSCGWGDTQSS